MSDLVSAFIDRAIKDGYEFKDKCLGDTNGAWRRLLYDGERRSSGRYTLRIDGDRAFGVYGSDKDPRGFMLWKSWDGENVSETDYAEKQAWMKAEREKIEELERQKHEEVAARLTRQWARFDTPPQGHGYTQAKSIKLEQAKYVAEDDELVFPAIDVNDRGRVYSAQYIDGNGEKRFEPGGRITGTVCPFKKPDESMDKAFICEGVSTGLTIREATGLPVFAGWNAGNLVSAAEALRKAYPETHFIVAADNDWVVSENYPKGKKWVNVGVKKGKAAAAAIGAMVIWPDFDETDRESIARPSDWNDYACLHGIDAVKDKLLEVARPAVADTSLSPTQSSADVAPSSADHLRVTANNWIQHIRWKDNEPSAGIFDKRYSLHNAKLILEFDPLWRGTFVYDEFQQTERVLRPLPWDKPDLFQWRDVYDTDLTQLRMHMSLKNIIIGSNAEMRNIINAAALCRSIHPVRAYFDKLKWDGVARLDRWAIDYLGADEQPADYVKAISKCWMIAAVKRIYEPGAEFHHMIVLEGGQAAGKSKFLKLMATFGGIKYFTDNMTFDLINKPLDAANMMRGCIIIEFAEMSGKGKTERDKIKQWITWTHDEYTPKFSNQIVRQPRQCVFAASTNESSYLDDPTGGRRFWPIRVGTLDHAGFESVKEQVWAEAIHRYKMGELHYIPVNDPIYDLAKGEQSQRYNESPWRVIIEKYIYEQMIEDGITTGEIMQHVLFIPQERWSNKQYQAAVGDVMRELGYENKLKWDKQLGKQIRKWVKS